MCSNKRRDYRFSLKNFTEEEYEKLINIDCKYIILGNEINKSGESKLQGYVYFKTPRVFQGIKNLVSRVEMEEMLSNIKLNYDYCYKLNNVEEKGTIPNFTCGRQIGCVTIFKPKEYEKSFASHEKSKNWSSLNTEEPEEVSLNSHKKYWFDCLNCGHSHETSLRNINIKNAGCPYCYNRKLCEKKNCTICFNKSFASHEKSEFWSSKNIIKPREILKFTHKKYWFDCGNCNHSFEKIINDITSNNSWCPYCANRLLCDEKLNCNYCLNKTFSCVDKSKYWSSKNKVKPNQIFKSTAEKYWFDCDKCFNEFESKLSHVTDGSWCPKCRYKTEDKLYKILLEKYPTLISQCKMDWCKNIKHLPFDFVLLERKIIIEQDGEQHWKQVAKWKTPEHNRERDIYKMKCANENGFSVIRLLQEDVLFDKYDWLTQIMSNINKITLDNRVQNIYMCLKDEYKDFVI